MNVFTVFLLFFLSFVLVAVIVFFVVKRKLNNITRSYLGKGVGETVKLLSDGLAEECMLPYPVPKLDAVYKPKIERDFPEMGFNQLCDMAKNGITDILNAVENGKPNTVANSSSRLKDQVRGIVEDYASKGEKIHYDNIKIHNVGIDSYSSRPEGAAAVFQVSLQSLAYCTANGKIVSGSNAKPTQNLFSITLSHNQNISDSGSEYYIPANCPNCGAPAAAVGSRNCSYCGTALTAVVDKIWQIDSFGLIK